MLHGFTTDLCEWLLILPQHTPVVIEFILGWSIIQLLVLWPVILRGFNSSGFRFRLPVVSINCHYAEILLTFSRTIQFPNISHLVRIACFDLLKHAQPQSWQFFGFLLQRLVQHLTT